MRSNCQRHWGVREHIVVRARGGVGHQPKGVGPLLPGPNWALQPSEAIALSLGPWESAGAHLMATQLTVRTANRGREDDHSHRRAIVEKDQEACAPIANDILVDSWVLVPRSHLYQADALQISTPRSLGCGIFLSADAELIRVARSERPKAWNVESEAAEIESSQQSHGLFRLLPSLGDLRGLGPAGHCDRAGPGHLPDPVGPEEVDECIDLLFVSRDLKR